MHVMEIGKTNRLRIEHLSPKACFLYSGGDKDFFLPPGEVPKGVAEGDEIDVFLYSGGGGEVLATTRTPYAVMDDFTALEVTGKTAFGVFCDWGLQKDLFIPQRNLRTELEPGDIAVLKIVPDYEGTGVIGTCKLDGLFDEDTSGLRMNQQVELLVFGFTKLGARVVIDNRFQGMLYRDEIFEKLRIGDSRTGFIKKIRDDGLVDAALQPQGYRAATGNARTVIMEALHDAGGFLPLHDKSSAEDIKNTLCMSKKNFKKAVGGLYRDRKISIEDGGIRLLR